MVRRGRGLTIVAGYPWFSDWGRDTFIALRGLCIAGNRLADARDILLGTRFELDLYVNCRPVRLLDDRLCPLP